MHGTILRTGIACQKIPCYMHYSACRWRIVENKIISPVVKKYKISNGLCKRFHQSPNCISSLKQSKASTRFLEVVWKKPISFVGCDKPQ